MSLGRVYGLAMILGVSRTTSFMYRRASGASIISSQIVLPPQNIGSRHALAFEVWHTVGAASRRLAFDVFRSLAHQLRKVRVWWRSSCLPE